MMQCWPALKSSLRLLALLLFWACNPDSGSEDVIDFYQTELFREVQLSAVFPDSKTFTDCTPKSDIGHILDQYEQEKSGPGFDLQAFVREHFDLPVPPEVTFDADTTAAIEDHIKQLWPVLTRSPDEYNRRSSLLPLPNPYIVPGGRFAEIYYWDTYFTMLGLKVDGRMDLVEAMVDNFAFLIDSVGFIPNGNRNYYLSRSQPPFFSLMVGLLAGEDDQVLAKYLPQLIKEHNFWMDGLDQAIETGKPVNHVVPLADDQHLNRYYDALPQPRPESYKEDVALVEESGRDHESLYADLRAACESGWDFSSRWFGNDGNLAGIRTTAIIPVDLNSLLYHLEKTISRAALAADDHQTSKAYEVLAIKRKASMMLHLWDGEAYFFADYDFEREKVTGTLSLAGVFPLYFGLAGPTQAEKVKDLLETKFLQYGGFLTTLNDTGEQWDAPNGWAPLQWMAIQGLRNYGYEALADEGTRRWLRLNQKVFLNTGKLVEKYNVMDSTLLAGGGEYSLQDGFGWTNGVYRALQEQ